MRDVAYEILKYTPLERFLFHVKEICGLIDNREFNLYFFKQKNINKKIIINTELEAYY